MSAGKSMRLARVEAIRGLAAVAVCLAHSCAFLELHLGVHYLRQVFDFGSVGVDLFFVISGFVIVYTAESLLQERFGAIAFMRKRIVRIMPLYWTTGIVLLVWIILARQH